MGAALGGLQISVRRLIGRAVDSACKMHGRPPSQRPLVSADGGHAIQVAVVDGVLQGGHDLLLPVEEVRPGEIAAGDGVVRDKGAVAV